jgi:hypothetical protein
VQKFDPTGNFVLMFGEDVNATKVGEVGSTQAARDVCTAASGDVCQAGGAGSNAGAFTSENLSITIDLSTGSVLIGDGDLIHKFTEAGTLVEDIALPAGTKLAGITVDGSGSIYASFLEVIQTTGIIVMEPDIRKLKSTGPDAEFLPPVFETERTPAGSIAVDPAGDLLVPVRARESTIDPAPESVLQFASTGSCLNCGAAGEDAQSGFAHPTDESFVEGIAVGAACGTPVTYLTRFNPQVTPTESYVSAFGGPPNPSACPPPVRPPEIRSQYGLSVQGHGATIGAEINPRFWSDTTYSVEYGTEPCSLGGCHAAPAPPGETLTEKVVNGPVKASVALSGLEPDTTYHFRFVASSGGGGPVRGVGEGHDGAETTITTAPLIASPPSCASDAFRLGLSAALPDCRAYEMVSPAQKEGGDIAPGAEPSFSYVQDDPTLAEASADGGRVTFSSLRAFANPLAAPLISQYMAVRGEDGWSTQSISPPRSSVPISSGLLTTQFRGFTEDLCDGWVTQESPVQLTEDAPAGVFDLYRQNSCGGPSTFKSLLTVTPPGFGGGPNELEHELFIPVFQGHSSDGSDSVYTAPAQLLPSACATPGVYQLYEVQESGPQRLVSVLPSGAPVCTNASVGTFGSHPGLETFRETSAYHAVSDDGESIYWTRGQSSSSGFGARIDSGPLYLRVNATQAQSVIGPSGECTQVARACTLSVSTGSEAKFVAASPDGASALYTESGALFQYDLVTRSSTPLAKGVTGVVGASEDLGRVYLVSTEALSGSQANSSGEEAAGGKQNLYLEEGGRFTFIAMLTTIESGSRTENVPSSPANTAPFLRTSRVTPDGSHLAFTSSQPLTGYDNADQVSGEPDSELYVFDVGSGSTGGQLSCVSCNPAGTRPIGQIVGSAGQATSFWASAQLPGWAEQLRPTRLLTADGDRLYFESFDSLVPRDQNGKRDVYEWERSSSESECHEMGAEIYAALADGCLSLISSGTSDVNSELIDASEGGRDVFFATEASLVPQDTGEYDIYDARENGGFPAPEKPKPCGEGHCQQSIQATASPEPGSTAGGLGNPVTPKPMPPPAPKPKPKRCPKGKHKVTKHGKARCVKNKSKEHPKGGNGAARKPNTSRGNGR